MFHQSLNIDRPDWLSRRCLQSRTPGQPPALQTGPLSLVRTLWLLLYLPSLCHKTGLVSRSEARTTPSLPTNLSCLNLSSSNSNTQLAWLVLALPRRGSRTFHFQWYFLPNEAKPTQVTCTFWTLLRDFSSACPGFHSTVYCSTLLSAWCLLIKESLKYFYVFNLYFELKDIIQFIQSEFSSWRRIVLHIQLRCSVIQCSPWME